MKKLIAVILMSTLILGLTGCYGGEIKLYNAMEKLQDVIAIQSEMEMEFTFEAEGFSEEDQAMLDQIAALLNTAKLKTNMKQTQNQDKTRSKAEMDTSILAAGMDLGMKIWVDVDLSGDEPKIVEVFQMPDILMESILPEGSSKEYLVYDIGEMMKSEGVEFDFKEIMDFGEEFQGKFMDFYKNMDKDFKPGVELVTQKDDRVIDGRNLEIFEIKLDDSTLKELVKYSVNYALDSEATLDFIKEYMDVVMTSTMIPEIEKEEMEAELETGLKELETKLPEFKALFNEFMDKYEDIEVLGEEGIVIEMGINDKGYIVHEAGNIDLKIDLEQISEALGVESMEGVIKFGIKYTSKNYNINNKVLMVRMPKITKGNSMDYMELLEIQMEQLEEQMKLLEEIEELEAMEEVVEEAVEVEEAEELPEVEEVEEVDETQEVEEPAA